LPLASLGLCLWWPLARLRLCLAGVDDDELARLRRERLRWLVLLAGTAAALVVLAGGVAAGARGAPAQTSAPHDLGVVATVGYAAAVVPVLAAVALWLYVRTMLRRALYDRERPPVVITGTVRRMIRPSAGGWPLLVRRTGGRGRWLTGSPRTLAPVRGRLTGHSARRTFQLTVTLTYYRRSRVIKEIAGVVVEDLAVAWQMSGVLASSSI
jgi:hypothetical protein